MSGVAAIYAVFASDEEARRIARTVVEERLAACANILGLCHSIYRWKGTIEEAEEVVALFKTAAGTAEALIARIAGLHSYEIPAITSWPIGHVPASYSAWIADETTG